MATQTPKRDNTHGEDNPKAPFGGVDQFDQNNRGVYDKEDENRPAGNPADPRGDSAAAGDPSDPRGDYSGSASRSGSSGGSSGGVNRDELRNQEAAGVSGTSDDSGADAEQARFNNDSGSASSQDGGNIKFRQEADSKRNRLSRIRNFKPNRMQVATLAIGGVLIGGGIFGASILSGPFQFIHMAQRLQKHFRSNEDFGNDRTSKVLIYALAGKDIQKGRLGVTSNIAADKWEKKMLEKTGMKPVYSEPLRRHVGFEIVNENKFLDFMGDQGLKNNKTSRKLEQLIDQNAELVSADNVRDRNDTKLNIVNNNGPVAGDARVLSIARETNKNKRTWITTINKSTDINNVVTSIGSRLAKKRGGVNFHPLSKVTGKIDEASAKRIQENRASNIEDGVEPNPDIVGASEGDADGDGNNDPPRADSQAASGDAKNLISEFRKSGIVKVGASSAAVVGVLCAAKQFGNGVDEYKYTNNMLPMLRMGMNTVATGSQAMAGNDIDLATMGVMVDYMYDKEKNTSWTQAESIRAEEGKTGGTPMPKEANLKNIGDKPQFFNLLDKAPGLDTACSLVDGFLGIPGIKQLSNAVGAITTGAMDLALKPLGSSTADLTESALKAVAGKSVNANAKGAEFGNLANTGTFLAANDQAIAMGGTALNNDQRTQLANLENEAELQEESSKSVIARYFDPYSSTSLAASIIDSSPTNFAQFSNMAAKPVSLISSSFSSLFSSLTPQANAAGNFEYGVPKYGFSLAERQNDDYENPYTNALLVEPHLDSLNEKYGDKCFGLTVTADDSGVHINSGDKPANVFKVQKDPDCNATTNTDDRFNHYRMYIADAYTAVSLACNEGDEQACTELGNSNAPSTDTTADSPSESDDSTGTYKIQKIDDPLNSPGGKIQPKGITLHWWGSTSNGRGIDALVDALRGNQTCSGGCSVQLGITSDGKVYQMTKNLTDLTYHAIGANQTTFGIEIEGGPEQFGKDGIEKYPEKFEAVVETVKYLVKKYNIPTDDQPVKCSNVSGVHPHSAYNNCPGAYGKEDIDDYYFNEVMKRVRQ